MIHCEGIILFPLTGILVHIVGVGMLASAMMRELYAWYGFMRLVVLVFSDDIGWFEDSDGVALVSGCIRPALQRRWIEAAGGGEDEHEDFIGLTG